MKTEIIQNPDSTFAVYSGNQLISDGWMTRRDAEIHAPKVTGHDAIELKERFPGVRLNKHADPIEGHRENISLDDAIEVASEDPSLIYVAARTFYAYSDSESEEITASSIDEAAEQFGIPSPDEIADGAFLLVRDEETYQEKTWGTVPR